MACVRACVQCTGELRHYRASSTLQIIDVCSTTHPYFSHDAGFESSGVAHALHRSPRSDAVRYRGGPAPAVHNQGICILFPASCLPAGHACMHMHIFIYRIIYTDHRFCLRLPGLASQSNNACSNSSMNIR